MPGPFVHHLDPVLGQVGGLYLWWYGLSYTLGFLGVFLWLRREQARLGLSPKAVYDLTLHLVVAVVLGGRLVEVLCYEWPYYSRHPAHIPALWLGGMSTHGLLLGAVLGTLIFCRRTRRSFLTMADALVIPGAWVMGVGRIGNFIDGQIAGSLTDGWWGVQFPDLEGFRHPVVLYDGLKNLALIPFLLWRRSRNPPRGMVFAHFVFWYAFLRLFVDLFREYPVETFGIETGQVINLTMATAGAVMLVWFHRRNEPAESPAVAPASGGSLLAPRLWLVALLLGCLVMPSDWTQDVPARYGKRHPGMRHSTLYPPLAPP